MRDVPHIAVLEGEAQAPKTRRGDSARNRNYNPCEVCKMRRTKCQMKSDEAKCAFCEDRELDCTRVERSNNLDTLAAGWSVTTTQEVDLRSDSRIASIASRGRPSNLSDSIGEIGHVDFAIIQPITEELVDNGLQNSDVWSHLVVELDDLMAQGAMDVGEASSCHGDLRVLPLEEDIFINSGPIPANVDPSAPSTTAKTPPGETASVDPGLADRNINTPNHGLQQEIHTSGPPWQNLGGLESTTNTLVHSTSPSNVPGTYAYDIPCADEGKDTETTGSQVSFGQISQSHPMSGLESDTQAGRVFSPYIVLSTNGASQAYIIATSIQERGGTYFYGSRTYDMAQSLVRVDDFLSRVPKGEIHSRKMLPPSEVQPLGIFHRGEPIK